MAQMTMRHYKGLKAELKQKKEDHVELMRDVQEAKEKGDLKENTEFETALSKAKQCMNRIQEIEAELQEAEVVDVDSSPKILIGSVLDITKVDEAGEPISPTRRFTLDSKGSTVLNGILGVNSPLGQVILNGSSGVYYMPQGGGIHYKVQKVVDTNE